MYIYGFGMPFGPDDVKNFLAAVASVIAATKTWLELRDRSAARKARDAAAAETLESPDIYLRASTLISLVPADTLERLVKRFKKCYDEFNEMLDAEGTKYSDIKISQAANGSLPYCVCRRLADIMDVCGELPDPKLQEAWSTYKCDTRL